MSLYPQPLRGTCIKEFFGEGFTRDGASVEFKGEIIPRTKNAVTIVFRFNRKFTPWKKDHHFDRKNPIFLTLCVSDSSEYDRCLDKALCTVSILRPKYDLIHPREVLHNPDAMREKIAIFEQDGKKYSIREL